ncbi:sugar ABC transporter permease [Pontibacillus sp. ALD_SL1]|uniref:ABC transporter permease n=1 Tax=Pontibacillus sp. ALD_SL1 TaxID=2777185 RepID=UPI001A97769E|nr:ABC transporter permease subunit [Pontibacillus sp. ALD_SL1]QSS98788.1 sugar ABC transporter permease [Pontibacillus sp. ALD_SL1]
MKSAYKLSAEHQVDTKIKPKAKKKKWYKQVAQNYDLYLLLLPTLIYFLIFHYIPMYGVIIAFKNYMPGLGILGSPWAGSGGMEHFIRFFESYQFWDLIQNTVSLSILQLVLGFPLPIIIALMLNQLMHARYKKFVQTVIYAPHFISVVVLVGMIFVFFSTDGLINNLILMFGGEPVNFLASPEWFKPLYIGSGLWQETGWGCIIYLAALAGVNPEIHEAAIVDGANKWKRILHVDIPAIMPTAVILLILSVGNIMNLGFEKAFLLQTDLNSSASEIIPTYVYKMGLQQAQYSFAAAIGLFNAVINLGLLWAVNRFAKKVGGSGIW